MGIVMLNNKVLMSENQMALYIPPSVTETWVIKDSAPVNAASRELAAQPCSFTSNGQSFNSISVTDPAATATYILSYDGLDVAGIDTGSSSAFDWIDDSYKTLVFDTPPTGDLLTWLQANATKQ